MAGDVIVVSGATHRAGLLDEYESQLASAGVPFHLEQIDPMPGGPNDMTMRRKLGFIKAMAMKFIEYRTIYITDAWDVLFFGTYRDLAYNSPREILFSAEVSAYPEADADGIIQGPTPWKYCNAGCYAGAPFYLIGWATYVETFHDLDILDQAWLNRHLMTPLVPLDYHTQYFYTVAREEGGALRQSGPRPYNTVAHTYPCFFHFSGGCPTDEIRKMVA